MSKLSLAGVSLVAAIPAGLLGWLLVDGFLNHFDSMPTALQAVAGLTLLVCAFVVLVPPGVLILGPKAAGAGKNADAKKSSKKKGDDAIAAEDELSDAGGADDELMDAGSEDLVEDVDDEMETLTADSEEFDLGDAQEEWETDELADDDEDSRETRRK